MAGKFSGIKIRKQFLYVTVLAVLLVLIVQISYYFRIAGVTKRNVENYTTNSVLQMEETIKLIFLKISNAATHFSYNSSVQSFMATDDAFEIFKANRYIEDMIKSNVEINMEIQDVIFLTQEGQKKYYYKSFDTQILQVLDQVQKAVRNKPKQKGFVYGTSGQFENREYLAYSIPVIHIAADSRRGEITGTIVVFLNLDFLKQIVKAADPENIEFYIIDEEKRVLVSNRQMDSGSRFPAYETDRAAGDGNIVIERSIGDTGFSIAGMAKGTDALRDYDFFKSFAIIVGTIMVLLLIAMVITLNSNIVLPLSKLVVEIGKIDGQNFKKRIDIPYKNEIGGIAGHINQMLDKLEALSQRIFETQQMMYESELGRKQTELYALQSQVNPHFLLNTIQCIAGIAVARGVSEIVDISASVADIFCYCIKGQDYVKVQEEVNIVKQYLRIIDIRFTGRFRWDIDIQQDMLERQTMKMLLQPLVENAVYHGLEKTYGEGSLYIKGRTENGYMLFEIWDNGPGIAEDVLLKLQLMLSDKNELEKESRRRKKIGIANIQWRLKLIMGEEAGLSIISSKEDGTVVKLKIPFM